MKKLSKESAEILVQHLIHPSKWGELPDEVQRAARPPLCAYEGEVKIGIALVDNIYFVLWWEQFGASGPYAQKTFLPIREYEEIVLSMASYPDIGHNFVYPTLGLCGEAGEVAEHIKKAVRNEGGKLTPERREKLLKELGDVLWYVAATARECGFSLEQVAQANIDKLTDRCARGVIKGEGDNR